MSFVSSLSLSIEFSICFSSPLFLHIGLSVSNSFLYSIVWSCFRPVVSFVCVHVDVVFRSFLFHAFFCSFRCCSIGVVVWLLLVFVAFAVRPLYCTLVCFFCVALSSYDPYFPELFIQGCLYLARSFLCIVPLFVHATQCSTRLFFVSLVRSMTICFFLSFTSRSSFCVCRLLFMSAGIHDFLH